MTEVKIPVRLEHYISYITSPGGMTGWYVIPSRELSDLDFATFPEGVFAFELFDQWVGIVGNDPVKSERVNQSPFYYLNGQNITRDELLQAERIDDSYSYDNLYQYGSAAYLDQDGFLRHAFQGSVLLDAITRQAEPITDFPPDIPPKTITAL